MRRAFPTAIRACALIVTWAFAHPAPAALPLADSVWDGAMKGAVRGAIIGGAAGALIYVFSQLRKKNSGKDDQNRRGPRP